MIKRIPLSTLISGLILVVVLVIGCSSQNSVSADPMKRDFFGEAKLLFSETIAVHVQRGILGAEIEQAEQLRIIAQELKLIRESLQKSEGAK